METEAPERLVLDADGAMVPLVGGKWAEAKTLILGTVGEPLERALDEGILRAVWMTRDELAACAQRHRSPLVLRCVDDYLAGQRAPLELVHTDPSAIGPLADQDQ